MHDLTDWTETVRPACLTGLMHGLLECSVRPVDCCQHWFAVWVAIDQFQKVVNSVRGREHVVFHTRLQVTSSITFCSTVHVPHFGFIGWEVVRVLTKFMPHLDFPSFKGRINAICQHWWVRLLGRSLFSCLCDGLSCQCTKILKFFNLCIFFCHCCAYGSYDIPKSLQLLITLFRIFNLFHELFKSHWVDIISRIWEP